MDSLERRRFVQHWIGKRESRTKRRSSIPDPYGRSLLHIAAEEGKLPLCSLLLEKGTPVNARDRRQCTPLHLAIKEGNGDVCRLLIESNAAVDATNENGETPLDLAIGLRSGDTIDLMVMLLVNSANPFTEKHLPRVNPSVGINVAGTVPATATDMGGSPHEGDIPRAGPRVPRRSLLAISTTLTETSASTRLDAKVDNLLSIVGDVWREGMDRGRDDMSDIGADVRIALRHSMLRSLCKDPLRQLLQNTGLNEDTLGIILSMCI